MRAPKVVSPPAPAPAGSALHTFLIADVRGYTRFTVEHGDEAAAELAETFAAVAREVVAAHEGEVVELRGDEALAVFSSARQALRAAVELQERFSRLTMADTSLPLKVGIGLDAGEAIAVEGGYRGAALNLAARLCSLAAPGEVLASEGVVHLARKVDGLSYLKRGAVQLKGFTDPVPVVQVVPEEPEQIAGDTGAEIVLQRALPIGGFLGALPAGPLVARDDEVRSLMASVDAVAEGSGRLVFLAGEPGVGKTRLAQEVTFQVRKRGFLVAAGRCYEPQEAVPFYPFLEALDTLYASASGSVRSSVPGRWPYLGHLLLGANLPALDIRLEGKEAQERLFWTVTGFLQAIAEEAPVALLLDDLHWADDTSLALLQHLARHTRSHRALLLGTYRDVEVGRKHPLERALRDLHREQLAQRVSVRRLDQEGTGALMAATFGQEVSTEFAEIVHRHTEGNPFFVHEVLRALVERGDVYREDGRWERREVQELSVPESIRSAIGERLSRLSEEAQTLLRDASVLGQSFGFEELQALANRTEEEVEQALEEAEAAGLLRAAEKDDYAFNHALTQQTLYGELSRRRQRRLHLAAGAVLERLPRRVREERAAELALHFLKGDDRGRALPYATLAGDQAEAVFAHAEAERQYRVALELARELEDRAREAEALEKLGEVLLLTARFDEALETLDRAGELYRADGDGEGTARTTMDMAQALKGKGRTGEAVTRLELLLEAFEGASASPGHARLYAALARHLFSTGRYHDMLTAADRATELARAVDDERILADAKLRQGTALIALGRMNEAQGALEEAAQLMERLGVVRVLPGTLANLGVTYLVLGEFERTRRLSERALRLAEQVGELWQIAFTPVDLSEVLFYLGHWIAARRYTERAAGVVEGSDPAWYTAYPSLFLAIVDLAEGSWEDGDRHMAACLSIARQEEDLQALRAAHRWLAERDLIQGRAEDAPARLQPLLDRPGLQEEQVTRILPCLGSAYLELGDMRRAEETLVKGLGRARRQNHRLALVDLLRVQGVLRSRQSRWEEAEQAFREAMSLARSMSYPYAQARALYERGWMYGRKGDPAPAQEWLEEALQIFRRLGARPYVHLTEEALALPR